MKMYFSHGPRVTWLAQTRFSMSAFPRIHTSCPFGIADSPTQESAPAGEVAAPAGNPVGLVVVAVAGVPIGIDRMVPDTIFSPRSLTILPIMDKITRIKIG